MPRHPIARRLAVIAALLTCGSIATAGQAPLPQLFVTGAVADTAANTITISGGNFGARPFVTLDLVPLDVRAATDTRIVAAAPVGAIPPADYLLTVSRGPAPADSATFTLSLGVADSPRMAAAPDALPSLLAGTAKAAQVGDRAISVDEIDSEWWRSDPSSYLQLMRRLYDARHQVLNTMVTDELLAREAAARGVSVEALLAEEVPKRAIAMPDSAVISLFVNLGNGARGATLEQMTPAIRAWLERHSEAELAKMSFVEELKKISTRADILLEAPRDEIAHTREDAVLGPPAAQIEIVAFGDFQSVEYARFAQSFARVRDTFGDRIRFVFKHLPMQGPQSVEAAEAASCANAQGRFWAYHDALVAPGLLDTARMTQSAVAAGLDRRAFDACMERHDFRAAVRAAVDEADRYGLHASPSFLINGRLAPAPPPFLLPYDYFKLLIEEELGRLTTNRAR